LIIANGTLWRARWTPRVAALGDDAQAVACEGTLRERPAVVGDFVAPEHVGAKGGDLEGVEVEAPSSSEKPEKKISPV